MKIAIVGIGAIGGVIAAKLHEKFSPILVSRNEEIVKKIRNEGLKLKDLSRKRETLITVYPEIYSSLKEIPKKFDVIFLCTKATSVLEAVLNSIDSLKDDGFFISFQNGIVEDRLLNSIPQEKLVGGIIGFGATMVEPGLVEMTSGGEIIIGEINGKITKRILNVKSILDSVATCRITKNIWGAKYSKLLINACITTMGAISGLTLGKMLGEKKFRKTFRLILYEGIQVGKKKGIKLENVSKVPIEILSATKREAMGKFSPSKYYKDFIIKQIGKKYGKLKSSSLQSLERKRKTEIDFINGIIVKYGKEVGINTPLNEKLVKIVHEIEEGKRKISRKNLEELFQ